MKKHFFANLKGSITVESSVVVPTIIFVLALLMIAFMLLYQKVLLIRVAAIAAQQGAEVWSDSRKDINTGAWDINAEKDSLYHELFDTSTTYKEVLDNESGNKKTDDKKIAKIRKVVLDGLKRGILRASGTSLEIKYTNLIIEGKVKVAVSQEIKLPFGQVSAFFGGKRTVTLKAEGTAVVARPEDYIRNVDLLVEYAGKVKESSGIDGLIDNLKSKVK